MTRYSPYLHPGHLVLLWLVVHWLVIGGCSVEKGESKANRDTRPPATGAANPRKSATRKPTTRIPQDAYAEVSVAIKAAATARETGNHENQERAETWLQQQGADIVATLATTLHDTQAEVPQRITACRVLAALGEAGRADVLKAMTSPERLIKIAATERISLIRPATGKTVQALVLRLKEKDRDCQRIAIQSLRRIGTPAKKAIPALESIVNQSQDEALQAEALKALKIIDPRHTLSRLRE